MSQEPGTASAEMASKQPAADRKQSRRALFAGAAGAGVGAVAATVLAGAQPASAATGDNCLLGESNTESSTTSISTSSGTGLNGTTSDSSGAGISGTDASSGGAVGVSGGSANGTGVIGTSTNGIGVLGSTSGNGQPAVDGEDTSSGGGTGVSGNSTNGTGVFGTSTNGTGMQGSTSGTGQSGVFGVDTSSGGGAGVFGTSTNGTGVQGSTSGTGQSGVVGLDASSGGGTGVRGTSTHGTGVQAASSAGTALAVTGKVTFSRSGTATVAAGKTSVTVTLAGVTKSSMILATIQQTAGRIAVSSDDPAGTRNGQTLLGPCTEHRAGIATGNPRTGSARCAMAGSGRRGRWTTVRSVEIFSYPERAAADPEDHAIRAMPAWPGHRGAGGQRAAVLQLLQ
jgi:hypothetical protein